MRTPVDADRLRGFMRALAQEARGPLQVYLVGGSTAVLEGWRAATIDVDFAFGESDDAVLRALPGLKERFDINVELASPADFIPLKPGWQDRFPAIDPRAFRNAVTAAVSPFSFREEPAAD